MRHGNWTCYTIDPSMHPGPLPRPLTKSGNSSRTRCVAYMIVELDHVTGAILKVVLSLKIVTWPPSDVSVDGSILGEVVVCDPLLRVRIGGWWMQGGRSTLVWDWALWGWDLKYILSPKPYLSILIIFVIAHYSQRGKCSLARHLPWPLIHIVTNLPADKFLLLIVKCISQWKTIRIDLRL